eukprot:2867939-Pyramimonas_sp.AAC.1
MGNESCKVGWNALDRSVEIRLGDAKKGEGRGGWSQVRDALKEASTSVDDEEWVDDGEEEFWDMTGYEETVPLPATGTTGASSKGGRASNNHGDDSDSDEDFWDMSRPAS